jgi:hypothetical protein
LLQQNSSQFWPGLKSVLTCKSWSQLNSDLQELIATQFWPARVHLKSIWPGRVDLKSILTCKSWSEVNSDIQELIWSQFWHARVDLKSILTCKSVHAY